MKSPVLVLLLALVASTSAIHENLRMGFPAPVEPEALEAMRKEVRAKLDGVSEHRQRELEYQKKLSEVAENIKGMRTERMERLQQRKNRYAVESP